MNDRGRMPFALVGVLLLVSSATLTATVGTYDPRGTSQVDPAMDGVTAETVTALRGAADDAATEAAAAPVTQPSNTTAGRALGPDQPFEDALRLRIYLAALDRLDAVSVRRGDVVAGASLPPVEDSTDGYRAAIDRVHVEQAGSDGAALGVEIEGLSLTASRGNRTVATDERNVSFVVANPALLLHNRTERFERRANADVTDRGLARRLTSRLYLIGWTRGYAQYGGAPIRNVIGTRHVELSTNDALIAEQRAVFGEVDPDSHRGMAAAGRRVMVSDALGGVVGDAERTDTVLEAADQAGADPPPVEPVGTWNDRSPDPEVPIGVNETADGAYTDLVGTEGDDELSAIVDRVHTVEARLDATVDPVTVTEPTEEGPGQGWEKIHETTRRRVELERTSGRAPRADGWETRRGSTFDATVIENTTRTWSNDGETTETESTVERDLRVHVTVGARTEPIDGVPNGDLDGALSNAADRATGRVIENAGGLQEAARSAAIDGPTSSTAAATAASTIDRRRLVDDLEESRERTRNVTVIVPAPALGTGRANPPSMLREELAGREDELLGARGTAPSERAVRASRIAYLNAVDDRLATAANAYGEVNDGIERRVIEHLGEDRLDGALAAHRMAERGQGDDLDDPGGELSLSVESKPGYLPTTEVRRDRIDVDGECTAHPLATRNVNVFASPHGQIAESVADATPVVGSKGVALETAAETLASEKGMAEDDRQALGRAVARANAHVRCELVAEMIEAGIAEETARAAVERDVSTAEEAMELANGTRIDQVASTVGGGLVPEDHLHDRLDSALSRALRDEAARPSRTATNEYIRHARRTSRDKLEETLASGFEAGTEKGKQKVFGERLGSVPAGLPVAPVPGYWYATSNVWYVEAKGTYERFVVRADRGDPTGQTTYIRDSRAVDLDRGDSRIRLGTVERVSFATETAVVVVVPPGGNGVGDTDGFADERSAGWGD